MLRNIKPAEHVQANSTNKHRHTTLSQYKDSHVLVVRQSFTTNILQLKSVVRKIQRFS